MAGAVSAVAVPRRQVDALAAAPPVKPVPGLGPRDGARARPLRLTDLVAARGVPHLYQAQVLDGPALLLLGEAPEGGDARARAGEVLALRATRVLEAVAQLLAWLES